MSPPIALWSLLTFPLLNIAFNQNQCMLWLWSVDLECRHFLKRPCGLNYVHFSMSSSGEVLPHRCPFKREPRHWRFPFLAVNQRLNSVWERLTGNIGIYSKFWNPWQLRCAQPVLGCHPSLNLRLVCYRLHPHHNYRPYKWFLWSVESRRVRRIQKYGFGWS